jgi:hypothetical protein
VKLGKVTDIRFTPSGGLGNQYTTINGVVYATWWDARTTPVHINSEVEFEVGQSREFKCPTARILRVIRQDITKETGA